MNTARIAFLTAIIFALPGGAFAQKETPPDKTKPAPAPDAEAPADIPVDPAEVSKIEAGLRATIADAEKSAGKDNPGLAVPLTYLARLLAGTDRAAEAEPVMRRVLALAEAARGKDHPEVAGVLNNLATLLHDMDRPADAEPLMRRAVVIYLADSAKTEKKNPNLADAMNNYGGLLMKMGATEDEAMKVIRTLASAHGVGLK